MKKILLVLILFAYVQIGHAQWAREWSMGYTYASPTGSMKQHINQGNGLILDFNMVSPTGKFAWGLDFNYTGYGFDKSSQQYTFPDGTTADMDINVTNSFTNLMASGRYNIVTGKALVPYVGFKAGYSWFSTDLNIYDPNDMDSCSPVETDILSKDGTIVVSFGGGVRYDLGNAIGRMRKEFIFLNLSVYHTQGGMVNYMNTDAPTTHQHSGMSSGRASDVEAAFINNQTQVVHKHHVGYLYSNYAQMMDVRFSIIFRNWN